jgi:hypothetical protein
MLQQWETCKRAELASWRGPEIEVISRRQELSSPSPVKVDPGFLRVDSGYPGLGICFGNTFIKMECVQVKGPGRRGWLSWPCPTALMQEGELRGLHFTGPSGQVGQAGVPEQERVPTFAPHWHCALSPFSPAFLPGR